MPKIEKITAGMFDDIHATYLQEDDPQSTKQDWQRLFQQYHPDHDCLGYALMEDAKIVGMLGMIFSPRQIGERQVDFCNLHSWFVEEKYRGHSLFLMRPALGIKDVVLTDFTPTPHVVEISKRIGFKQMDGSLQILLPHLRRDRGDCEIVSNPDQIRNFASPAEQKLMDDHPAPGFGYLMIRQDARHCLVIHTTVQRHWLKYCYVLYASDVGLFSEASCPIRSRLKRETKSRYVAVNARQFSTVPIPSSFKIPASSTQMVRGDGVDPSGIDMLYSEVAFLQLTTMPSVSQTLRPSWLGR